MHLKLAVGVSRKVGLPHYGSVGASCAVELTLDGSLAEADRAGFLKDVRIAYTACRRAVDDELSRQRNERVPDRAAPPQPTPGTGNGPGRGLTQPGRATGSQLRALRILAGRRGINVDALATNRFEVAGLEQLAPADAGALIMELGGWEPGLSSRPRKSMRT